PSTPPCFSHNGGPENTLPVLVPLRYGHEIVISGRGTVCALPGTFRVESRFLSWHVASVSWYSTAKTPRLWRDSGARLWTSSCSIGWTTARWRSGHARGSVVRSRRSFSALRRNRRGRSLGCTSTSTPPTVTRTTSSNVF